MFPSFWLTVQIKKIRIPLPLFLMLPLIPVLELLAIIPAVIYAKRSDEKLPLKVVSGLHISRLMLAFALHGRKFGVNVCDGEDTVRIMGRWKTKKPSHKLEDSEI